MNNIDRAIKDIEKIVNRSSFAEDDGAVPMPFRTLNESLKALKFEKELLELVHGYEVNAERAIARTEKKLSMLLCNEHLSKEDVCCLATEMDVFKKVLKKYFEIPYGRRKNGHK